MHVAPAPAYQRLTVIIDGEHYSSLSDEELVPNRPHWFYREIPRLPEGEYRVVAILDDPTTTVTRQLTLVRH